MRRHLSPQTLAALAAALVLAWIALIALLVAPAWGRLADARLLRQRQALRAQEHQQVARRLSGLRAEVQDLSARLQRLEGGMSTPNETGALLARIEDAAQSAGITLTSVATGPPQAVTPGSPGAPPGTSPGTTPGAPAAYAPYFKAAITIEAAGSRAALMSYLLALGGIPGLALEGVDLVTDPEGVWRATARGNLYMRAAQ